MPFGGLTSGPRMGSRSDKYIRHREGWQEGDAAFCQNSSITSCWKYWYFQQSLKVVVQRRGENGVKLASLWRYGAYLRHSSSLNRTRVSGIATPQPSHWSSGQVDWPRLVATRRGSSSVAGLLPLGNADKPWRGLTDRTRKPPTSCNVHDDCHAN